MQAAQTAIAFVDGHRDEIALGVALFVATLLGSLAVVAWLLVRMPADYLEGPEATPLWPDRPLWQRVLARVAKNLLGAALVVVGVVLSVPGVPGQGALTIVIGIMLLDVPGKRRIERRMLGQRRVHAAVNRLRARFGRAPLVIRAP
ncbi:MAG: hypothetical protein IT372_27765 [Polyangiaceae bacterium]|nr:hypothetical protein [Polyangiaceae bacterium]